MIDFRQIATLSAWRFQQLASPDNIIEYMLPTLTLSGMLILPIHHSNLIFEPQTLEEGREGLSFTEATDITRLYPKEKMRK